MPSDPRLVYCRFLEERRADIASRERRHRIPGMAGWRPSSPRRRWSGWHWPASLNRLDHHPIAIFAVLVAIHDRLLRILERRRRAQRFFERALARLDGR